jgi:hypothetical protein
LFQSSQVFTRLVFRQDQHLLLAKDFLVLRQRTRHYFFFFENMIKLESFVLHFFVLYMRPNMSWIDSVPIRQTNSFYNNNCCFFNPSNMTMIDVLFHWFYRMFILQDGSFQWCSVSLDFTSNQNGHFSVAYVTCSLSCKTTQDVDRVIFNVLKSNFFFKFNLHKLYLTFLFSWKR